MKQYNDGLNNETEVQIISTYRRPLSQKTKDIISDLGTTPSSLSNAVMYSNSNSDRKLNLNLNLKENTLQQIADNDAGYARELPSEAFGPSLRGREEEEKKSFVGIRDLDPNHEYTQIEVQMGNIRTGRYKRADIYISLMTIDDSRYTIKLTSDITNAYSEVKRNVDHSQYWTDKVKELLSLGLDDLLIGRARYKQTKDRPLWQTKPNLGNILVAHCVNDDVPIIMLYMFTDDPILIPLDKELSTSQKKYYQYTGMYKKKLQDI